MTIAGATKVRMEVRMEVRMVNTAVKTDRESTYIAPHIKKIITVLFVFYYCH